MKPSNPIDWDDTRCRIPREARNPAIPITEPAPSGFSFAQTLGAAVLLAALLIVASCSAGAGALEAAPVELKPVPTEACPPGKVGMWVDAITVQCLTEKGMFSGE